MIGTFFRLVGKALRMAVNRPLQRFNIANRAKKHLGEDAKYFMPAPRAIGALSQGKPILYPHLEGQSSFKSIKQKRLEAITARNQRLLTEQPANSDKSEFSSSISSTKSFSETINDDHLVINASNKLPVIKTVIKSESPGGEDLSPGLVKQEKLSRPLPKSTNLQLSDPAVIWNVDRVPPGRLDLNKLQELMINKLADDEYWTPQKIAETYNIKEEYAENLITYFKQIRIIISPGLAKNLDYVARNDPVYQATKDTVYFVDKSLRSEQDKLFDATFLPTDDPGPEIKELLEASAIQKRQQPDIRLTNLVKRPKPLQLQPINRPEPLTESQAQDDARQIESTVHTDETRH